MRARIAFFVEAYFSKVNTYYYPAIAAPTDDEADALGVKFATAVCTEIDPLLHDAAPFFGGSEKLTMAEVSFFSLANIGVGGKRLTLTTIGSNCIIYHSYFHTANRRKPATTHDNAVGA